MKKHKALKIIGKIIGLSFLALFVLLIVGVYILFRSASSMGIGTGEVADYEKRIAIWNTIPGNSSNSKLDDMKIKYNGNLLWYTLRFSSAIVGDDFRDQEEVIDTFTYLYEIKGGYEKETYEDEPYLIPYLAEGSDCAVIVLPGGGFGYKSMDGTDSEGRDVAVTLQENGINAFVLHYRSNPYEYPIPQLDVQRAVRYIRYHAEEYGIDPEKIGLIGFSAGGFQIGSFINLIQGNDLFPEGYTPDEIDQVDDRVAAPAMIYPALTFNYNKSMLLCLFDADAVRDEGIRQEYLALVDQKNHVENSAKLPQFIAWRTKDTMVGTRGTAAYIEAAKAAGVAVTEVIAEGQEHGFAQEYYMNQYLDWVMEIFELNS